MKEIWRRFLDDAMIIISERSLNDATRSGARGGFFSLFDKFKNQGILT